MSISSGDAELIDRLSDAKIRTASSAAQKELRSSVSQAARIGALGAGRFHLQIVEHYIDEYRTCGNILWDTIREVLEASGSESMDVEGDGVKQFLLQRLVSLWRRLESDLERDLTTHHALTGLVARLGDAHQALRDEMFARIDLYSRQSVGRHSTGRVQSLDELTGLPDRKELKATLNSLFATAPAAERPVSIVLVDVDKFKAVNDTHGHSKGDSVLRTVGQRLAASVDQKGRAFRLGGEEFVLLLPNCSVEEATVTAERVRKVVAASDVEGLRITVSLGVAEAPTHASDANTLMNLADAAMYDAKNLGRDLVRIHGELPQSEAPKHVPERKPPAAGGWTEKEAASIRQEWFTRRTAVCPRDSAILEVHESQELGVNTPRLLTWCKLCGTRQSI